MKTLNNLSKTILAVCLTMLMAVAMALPTFALAPDTTGKLYAWNGRTVNGSKAALTSMEYNARAQVRTGAGNQQWTIKSCRSGDYVIQNNDGYYLNIYRVAYPSVGTFVYYYATSYVLEDSIHAFDQRVKVSADNTIKLAEPQVSTSKDKTVSCNWFLLTDKSSPSTSSDVIWYGDYSTDKAKWTR